MECIIETDHAYQIDLIFQYHIVFVLQSDFDITTINMFISYLKIFTFYGRCMDRFNM